MHTDPGCGTTIKVVIHWPDVRATLFFSQVEVKDKQEAENSFMWFGGSGYILFNSHPPSASPICLTSAQHSPTHRTKISCTGEELPRNSAGSGCFTHIQAQGVWMCQPKEIKTKSYSADSCEHTRSSDTSQLCCGKQALMETLAETWKYIL